jgi:SH3 domain-containing YSC84-like protein 1
LWVAGATNVLADTVAERLSESAAVLKEIMDAPDKGVPGDLLSKARCVVVVPGVKKAGFIIGAKYGRGFVVCRKDASAGWVRRQRYAWKGGASAFRLAFPRQT